MTTFKNTPLPYRTLTDSWPRAIPGATPVAAAEATRTIAGLQGLLRTLTTDVGAAELRERARIACQLHDELGQHLVLVRLKLGELRAAPPCQTQRLVDDLIDLVGQTAAAARSITFDLGQPEDGSLLFGKGRVTLRG